MDMKAAGIPRGWKEMLRSSSGDGMDICAVPAGRISCHNLNLVLSHGLRLDKSAAANNDNEDEPSGVSAKVVQLINFCKEIVTQSKRTKINIKLDNTLKQCVVTRWNSTLTTMKSVAAKTFKICIQSAQRLGSTATCYDYWLISMPIC